MQPNKTVLTTGEVAKICNVAPRTVSKWFDTGQLRGYRIPGSKDRRIPLDHLVRFMRAHGIPLNGLDSGRKRILLLDADTALCKAIASALGQNGEYEVAAAASALEAGALAQTLRPQVMIIDVSLPDVSPPGVVRFFQCQEDLAAVALIATARELTEAQGLTLVQQGFASWLCKPFDLASLRRTIEACSNPHAAHSGVGIHN
jgi:excisionase family DNA binding protein